jgi:hypothetical protein
MKHRAMSSNETRDCFARGIEFFLARATQHSNRIYEKGYNKQEKLIMAGFDETTCPSPNKPNSP